MKVKEKKVHAHIRESKGDFLFGAVIAFVLIVFAIATAIPLISELAVSLSSKTASQMNRINLLPVEFTLEKAERIGENGLHLKYLAKNVKKDE